MENLNAETVKKALECCTRGRKSKEDRPCLDCHYNECNLVGGTSERQTTGTCQGWLMKDALALINSQGQRIKELTGENEDLRIKLAARIMAGTTLKAVNKKLTEENERLKAPKYRILPDDRIEMIPTVESVRADTVRKMQERLKKQRFSDASPHDYDLLHCFIDGVAEEILEGENE